MYDQAMIVPIAPVIAGAGQLLTAAADIGGYMSYQPFRVRGVGITITTTCTATAPVIDFYRRPVAGTDAGRVLIKRLNPTLGQCAAGKVIMAEGLNTLISPGEDLIAEVSTTSTAGAGLPCAYIEPQFESSLNSANITKIA